MKIPLLKNNSREAVLFWTNYSSGKTPFFIFGSSGADMEYWPFVREEFYVVRRNDSNYKRHYAPLIGGVTRDPNCLEKFRIFHPCQSMMKHVHSM